MARLPTVGGDNSNWGTLLNEYLGVEHKADGTHSMGLGLVTENVNTVGAAGASLILPALTTATLHNITLTANCAITLPAAVAGQSFAIVFKQDATGSRTITWTGTVKWAGGIAPTLTTTTLATDVLSFVCINGTDWLGFVSGQDMK
jgi:hypothetical protein